jgi:hypothetical protein
MEPVQARLEVWMSRAGLVRSAIGCKAEARGADVFSLGSSDPR